MESQQLDVLDIPSKSCPFKDLIEDGDNHCLEFSSLKQKYNVIGEDHKQFAQWLAEVRGVGFDNVVAGNTPEIIIPSYLPTIKRGSQKLLKNVVPPFVAISLGDIITENFLSVPDEVRIRFGIHPKSKILLLCYGKDRLIEKIWTNRKTVFPKIASLGFDLVTGINYSIWFNDPHAERLINLKRSLITFEEFQALGIPAIPHIYWFGKKDILRWCDWLSKNKNVKHVALNLQTQRGSVTWEKDLEELQFFIESLNRPIDFLVNGPSQPKRIEQIKSIIPTFSLVNGHCSRIAASSFLISQSGNKLNYQYSRLSKNLIMEMDIKVYRSIMENINPKGFLDLKN